MNKLAESDSECGTSAVRNMFPLRLARRMARLGTETAFEVLVKARGVGGEGTRYCSSGNRRTGFRYAGNIIDAAIDALHQGFTHYGPSAGSPELRETIAEYVSETRRVNVTPDERGTWFPAVTDHFFL
jgi:Aspartate/tyrosine/aromatic aminotransferase